MGSVGQGAFSVSHDRVTKWGPADPKMAAFSVELREMYTDNFISIFKGS